MSITLHRIWSESLNTTNDTIKFLQTMNIKIEYNEDPYVTLILSLKNTNFLSDIENEIVNNELFQTNLISSKLPHDEKLSYCLFKSGETFSLSMVNSIRTKIIEKYEK